MESLALAFPFQGKKYEERYNFFFPFIQIFVVVILLFFTIKFTLTKKRNLAHHPN